MVVILFGLAFERLGDMFKRKEHAIMSSNCASNKAQLEMTECRIFFIQMFNLFQIH